MGEEGETKEFEANDEKVNVLLLAFKYSSIKGLEKERDKVWEAFQETGFQVRTVTIDMTEPWDGWSGLGAKLRMFLSGAGKPRIIYYHGYGMVNKDKEMEFVSHDLSGNSQRLQIEAKKFWTELQKPNLTSKDRQKIARDYPRYQERAVILWDKIRTLVMEAEHNVLVILDCRLFVATAGQGVRDKLAKPIAQSDSAKYAKGVIATTVWNSDEMCKALCGTLDKWNSSQGPDLSVEELYQRMRDGLTESVKDLEEMKDHNEKRIKELGERKKKGKDSKEIGILTKAMEEYEIRQKNMEQTKEHLFRQSVNGNRKWLHRGGEADLGYLKQEKF